MTQDTVLLNANRISTAMTVFDHAVAAMERQLLAGGAPVDFLARVMMQHAASILALVEPAAVRAEVMKMLIGNFPAQVRAAQLAASTTKSGLVVPVGVVSAEEGPRPI